MRGPYKGKWTEFNMTAKQIGVLAGTSTTNAKRYLYALHKDGYDVNATLVGELIQLIRNKNDLKFINRAL
jgi:hypothetical protein